MGCRLSRASAMGAPRVAAFIVLFVEGVALGEAAISGTALRAGRQETKATADRSIRDGVYADEQARRGQALYRQECASCHGETLAGGQHAPALTGDYFLRGWE